MPITKGIRYSKAPCTRCGKPIATTALAQHNHARACQATAPACGCTQTVRCPEARRLRHAHHADREAGHWMLAADSLESYGAHLRAASVTPGQAQWEEEA